MATFTALYDLYLLRDEPTILDRFAAIATEFASPASVRVAIGPAWARGPAASFPLFIEGKEAGAVLVEGRSLEELGPARTALLSAASEVLGDVVGRCREWARLTGENHLLRALVAPPGTGPSETAERFRFAFDAAPDAVALSTYDAGVFLDINPAFTKLTGYGREEVIGRRSLDLGLWVDPAQRSRIIQRLRVDGGFVEEEISYRRKDGSTVPCLAYGRMLELPEGLLVLTYAHDLTARRTLEQRLREAEKLESVGRLAGGVAHEFNNLATIIMGNAELLADRLGDQGEHAPEAGNIIRAARRAAVLTRRLVAYSGRQSLKPVPADLNTAIGELLREIKELAGSAVETRLRCNPEIAAAYVDPDQLREIITELVRNAGAAMPSGGVLTIGTEEAHISERNAEVTPGRYVVLVVSDTGAGMDEQTKSKLFDPFFSGRGNLAEATGLGLAVVYGTVRQSNGFIRVTSAPGVGTEFRVFLPVAASQRTTGISGRA